MKKTVFLSLIVFVITSFLCCNASAQTGYGDQFANMGFENWANFTAYGGGTTYEPANWHSLGSGTCGLWIGCGTAMQSQVSSYSAARPGSPGSTSVKIYAKSVLNVIANGTLVNGQMNVGSMTASNPSNYMGTVRSNNAFHTDVSSIPDSITIWASYYCNSTSNTFFIHTAVHGDADFRLLADGNYDPSSKLVAKGDGTFTRTTSSSSTLVWKRYSVPYVVDGDCTCTDPRYLISAFSTNNIPGGGASTDVLYIDDVLLIYNPTLATGTISPTSYLLPSSGGVSISIPYILTGSMSPYNLNKAANQVIAELSDASGSFSNPIELGRVTSDVSGTISGTIPSGTPLGTGYRVRVRSTNYPMTAANNGSNITIYTNYTISVSANPTTGGTVTGAGSYANGTSVTVTATPNTDSGYSFVNWTENGTAVSTNTSYTFTATANRTLVANFALESHTITATANPSSAGTISGTGSYNYGATATLVATANSGWRFNNWTENGSVVSSSPSFSFTVTSDRVLTANFVQQFTLSLSASPTAGGTVSGSGTFDTGTSVTASAIANSGYSFVSWTENGTVISTNASYTFSITSNRTLVANFSQIVTYTVSATVSPTNSGTVTGTGSYQQGATATLTAAANTGYAFVNWTENGTVVSTNSTYSFTVSSNRTLVAHFVARYTITVTANPTSGGVVSGGGTFNSGETVTVTALANANYEFSNWTENGTVVSSNTSYSFTASANRTLIANFLPKYSVTVSADPAEGGTPSGAGTYVSGATVTVNTTVNNGYSFVNWTNNGTQVSTQQSYAFDITENTDLVANFSTIPTYTVAATANPEEGGSIIGTGTFLENATVTLVATANTGYRFVNWTENGTVVSANSTYSFAAAANRTLVANFIARYTVTLTTIPTGAGTLAGAGTYDNGTTVTLTAVAAAGYVFSDWTENGEVLSTSSSCEITVSSNRNIIANFIPRYTITLSVNPENSGTVTGNGTYTSGTLRTVIATTNTGYEFENWTENDEVVSTESAYTFTLTANRTLVANFTLIPVYTISATVSPDDNAGTITGTGDFMEGSTVSLQTTANTGYRFVNWTEDGTVVSTNSTYSFTATGNRTLVANFIARYTVTLSSNPTGAGTLAGAGTYDNGTTVTLTAVAATGYVFSDWTENGEVLSVSSTFDITVSSNRNIIANFIPRYSITLSVNPENSGTVTGNGTYTSGTQRTVRATANTGYEFENWTENGEVVSTESAYTFTLTANRILVANFTLIPVYTISATVSPDDNAGTIIGTGEFMEGTSVSLHATANTGYRFVNWTEDGTVVSTNATYSFSATADRTLVANFIARYTVTLSSNPTGAGTLAGAGTYDNGTTVTLTAVAATGYVFSDWTENGEVLSTSSSCEIIVSSNRNIIANFIPRYTITLSVNPENSGTVTGNGTYTSGTQRTVRATANTGYEFESWTENGEVVSTESAYTFTLTANRTLVANFTLIPVYTISATVSPDDNAGTITGTGEFMEGTSVSLHATANTGYRFVNWTEDGTVVSTNSTYSFTATENRTLVANFIARHTVTLTSNPTGAGTLVGAGTYDDGTTVTLTAVAATGYVFSDWTENGVAIATTSTCEITVTSDRDITANFIPLYTISLSVNPENSGTVTGAGTYTSGTQRTVRATANAGYEFGSWTENGEVVSTESTYTFTLTANRTLVANFTLIPVYTISATVSPDDNAGTVTGTGEFMEGTSVSLHATANTGYRFVNWTEDGTVVSTNSTYSFTATEDRTLVANFIARYTVTLISNPTGAGTLVGAGTYDDGSSVTLTAVAATGYVFSDWTENGVAIATTSTCEITVTSDRDITANFIPLYTISLSVTPETSGTVTGAGTYTSGTQRTVRATANAGYEFCSWTENGEVVSTESTYTFTLTANRTLVANFTLIPVYTISATVSPDDNTGTVSGTGEYMEGTSVSLHATANTGYRFVSWTEDGTVVSTNSTYSFTATEDRTLVANFIARHTVTLTSNPTGAGTLVGAGTYDAGTTVTLTAVAATGYVFSNWTENGVVIAATSTCEITAISDRDIIANFIPRYTISLSVNPENSGTVTGAGTYTSGTQRTVRATANAGYEFGSWTENGEVVSTESTYIFTLSANRTLVANFTPKYTVTILKNISAGGTVTGAGTFVSGASIAVSTTVNAGYAFENWTVDGISVSTETSYTFTLTSDITITANYSLIPVYTISAVASPTAGGSITGAGDYLEGASVSLVATPNQGFDFVNWTEDGNVLTEETTYSFVASANRTLTAKFFYNVIGYDVTVSANPTNGGTVSGGGSYEEGTEVTVYATPASGYEFVNWTEDGTEISTDATYSFTISSNRNLVANFNYIIIYYDITLSADPTEGGTVSGGGNFAEGTEVTALAEANANYDFTGWTENGTLISEELEYSFTVSSDRTLVANFIRTYIVTVAANPDDAGTVSGRGTYRENSTATVTATANANYEFINWTDALGNVMSSISTYSFSVTADVSLTANFIALYTITVTPEPVEGGTISGGGIFTSGENVTVLAVANAGYEFVGWTESGEVVSSSSTYSFAASSDRNLIANFDAIVYYDVEVSANPVEGGSVSGAGTYEENTSVTVTATVAAGYNFVNWTENGEAVATTPTYTFEITSDRTLVANFEAIVYCTVTLVANPTEGGTVSGGGVFEVGTTATVTATINTNYEFVNWTDDLGNVVSTHFSYSFAVSSDITLTANFIALYTITVTADPVEGGTVSGGRIYYAGENVTVLAVANAGYEFVGWIESGEVVSSSATYSFAASSDRNLVANFEAIVYYDVEVSANPAEGGSVSGAGTYEENTSVTVTATAAAGYNFVNWTENGEAVATTSTYTFEITSDITLVANFEAIVYCNVTIIANPTEGGTVSGGGVFEVGTTVTVTAAANANYEFVNWTDADGNVVSSLYTYSFAASTNVTLTANFIALYTITVTADPADGGTVSGGRIYSAGENVTVLAVVNAGYVFAGWTENGETVSSSTTYSFAALSDRNLVANFDAIVYYAVVLSANPAEGGSVTGDGMYEENTNVTVTATTAAGYNFINWTENGETVATTSTYTFDITSDRTLVANFEAIVYYTVTVAANPTEGGTVSGGGVYEEGTTAIVTATTGTNYEFVNWTDDLGNVVSIHPSYSFTASSDITLTANFIALYTITVTADPAEGGTVSGGRIYSAGENVTVLAVVNTGYVFAGWTENGDTVSSSTTYSFVASSDRNLVANFDAIVYYDVEVSANPVEGGSVTGAGTYEENTNVTVTATASAGYNFVNWTENGETVATTSTYTFNVTSDRTLVANFEAIVYYTVTVLANPVEGGSVTGGGVYEEGTTVTVAATTNANYEFVNWTDASENVVSTLYTYSFTASADVTLTANYIALFTITVTANPADGGAVSGSGIYTAGENVTVLAVVNTGYEFIGWTENGETVSSTTTYSFVASCDRNLVAEFEAIVYYNLSLSANPVEGGTVTGAGIYEEHTSVTVTATAAAGYNFINWTENGEEVSATSIYTFDITSERTLVANFEAIVYYTVTVAANPIEGGVVAGAGVYEEGTTVTVSATANASYEFVNWTDASGTVVSNVSTYSFAVTSDMTLTANFIALYSITVTANPADGGVVSGSGIYSAGENVTVLAVANTGYEFFGWTENGETVSSLPTYTFVASADRNLIAEFEAIVYYTVTATANPVEGGTVTGGGVYEEGENVTVIATVAEGYDFISWTEDGNVVTTETVYYFQITGDRNLTANFEQIIYNTLEVAANPEEGGVVTGGGVYVSGTTLAVTATANADWNFFNWTENGEQVSTSTVYTFELISDRSLIANFVEVFHIELTASPENGGTVSGGGSYSSGQTITVLAIPADNYVFAGWMENGSIVSSDASYSFTVTADRVLTAVFDEILYYDVIVAASPEDGGTVSGAGTYVEGSEVTVSAVVNAGFEFVNWTEDGIEISNVPTFSFNIEEDRNFVANFIEIFTVEVIITPEDGGIVSGAGNYYYGDEASLIAIPNDDYVFVAWKIDGEEVSNSTVYTFTVESDVSIEAEFQHFNNVEDYYNTLVDVYPNPAADYFRVESSHIIRNITVISSTGKKVYSAEVGTYSTECGVSGLKSGYYIVCIEINGVIISKKVLVR